MGTGGGCCRVDIRFNLLASVGLIVRAPKPVACRGIVDMRLLEPEDGVCVLRAGDFPGDLEFVMESDLACSGVLEGVVRCP